MLITVLFVNLKKTIKLFECNKNKIVHFVLFSSLSIQIIWIVYGLTGNPFYYSQQLLTYIFAVSAMEEISNDKNRCFNIP